MLAASAAAGELSIFEQAIRVLIFELNTLFYGPLVIAVEPRDGRSVLFNGRICKTVVKQNEDGSLFIFGLEGGTMRNLTANNILYLMATEGPTEIIVWTAEKFGFVVMDKRYYKSEHY